MHLVDLAGSERVSKTRILGTILTEAKHINLSLHFLEQVIISLQERDSGQGRIHIPFRNSMLTTALRDSLGGNCRTVMVANVAATADQAEETVSTCRFAQRVALISNTVTINEEVDPAVLVKLLKQEIQDLKEELRLLKASHEISEGGLTAQHYSDLSTAVAAYLADPSPEASFHCGSDTRLIRSAMAMMKAMINKQGSSRRGTPAADAEQDGTSVPEDIQRQLDDLQSQVQQRDSEIGVLVKMLRRPSGHDSMHSSDAESQDRVAMHVLMPIRPSGMHLDQAQCIGGVQQRSQAKLPDKSIIADRDKALRYWDEHHFDSSALQGNKQLLRQHYCEAKLLGDKLDSAKETITRLRAELQSRSSAAKDLSTSEGTLEDLKQQIQEESTSHSTALDRLRKLKPAIEHLQLFIEKGQNSRVAAFDEWHTLMLRLCAG